MNRTPVSGAPRRSDTTYPRVEGSQTYVLPDTSGGKMVAVVTRLINRGLRLSGACTSTTLRRRDSLDAVSRGTVGRVAWTRAAAWVRAGAAVWKAPLMEAKLW